MAANEYEFAGHHLRAIPTLRIKELHVVPSTFKRIFVFADRTRLLSKCSPSHAAVNCPLVGSAWPCFPGSENPLGLSHLLLSPLLSPLLTMVVGKALSMSYSLTRSLNTLSIWSGTHSSSKMLYARTKRLTPNSMAGRRGVCASSRLLLHLPHGGDSVPRHTRSLLAVSIGKTYALNSSFQLYSHHHQSTFSLLNLLYDDIFLCASVSVAHK